MPFGKKKTIVCQLLQLLAAIAMEIVSDKVT